MAEVAVCFKTKTHGGVSACTAAADEQESSIGFYFVGDQE